MRIWPGLASSGRCRSGANRSTWLTMPRRRARLQALGIVYPCFASRKEIAAAVESSGKARPATRTAPPLSRSLPRHATGDRVCAHRRGRALRAAAEYGEGTRAGRAQARRAAALPHFDAAFSSRSIDAAPERWGDIVLCAKGAAGDISYRGRGGRCSARRHPCHAWNGPFRRDRHSPAAANPRSTCPNRFIAIIALSSIRRAASSPNPTGTWRSGACAPEERRRRRSRRW